MGVTRKVLNWYARLSPGHGIVNPPYEHVIQIGDPRLRRICEPIPIDKIKMNEIQNILRKLQYVLNKYGSLGMSAPQLGVNLRIIAMQHKSKQISSIPKETVTLKGLSVVPYTVFINPHMKVVDYKKVSHVEGCESIRGFGAEVPRYSAVEISGYDQEGQSISRVFKNWAARIAQHELDHLDGKLYTDVMDRKTLHCTCWEEVNLAQGRLSIPFTPK